MDGQIGALERKVGAIAVVALALSALQLRGIHLMSRMSEDSWHFFVIAAVLRFIEMTAQPIYATSAADMIASAFGWLASINENNSMMAFHALGQAEMDLECAATLLGADDAVTALALAARCHEAAQTAGFPYIDNELLADVDALREALK